MRIALVTMASVFAAMLLAGPSLIEAVEAKEGGDPSSKGPKENQGQAKGHFKRDHYGGSSPSPGIEMFLEDDRPLFLFTAMEVQLRKGNVAEGHALGENLWEQEFDTANETVIYRSTLPSKGEGIPGGGIDIELEFRPTWNDTARKIEYNLTLGGDLDVDSISVQWTMVPIPEELGEEFPEDHHGWSWSQSEDHAVLDDSRGKDMAHIHWGRDADARKGAHRDVIPVVYNNTLQEENITIQMTLDVSEGFDSVEAGGYIDFLDEFIDMLISGTEKATDLVRDHLLSFALAAAVASAIALAGLLFVLRPVRSDPKELEYRNSSYYRKDQNALSTMRSNSEEL